MHFGGPAKLVYELALEQSLTNQVEIWTSDAFSRERRLNQNERIESSSALSVRYFSNLWNKAAYDLRFFSYFGIIATFIKKGKKFDVVHFHDIFILPQLLCALWLILRNRPYFVSPHGVLDPQRQERRSLAKNVHMPLVRFVLNRAETLIATSEKESADLKSLQYKNCIVHPNGIGKTHVKSKVIPCNISKNSLTLLYIGKMHPQKGVKEFLLAVKQLAKPVNVIIAGPDDGQKSELLEIAKDLDTNNTHFIEYVNEEEKEYLYGLADLFVYPSYSEGFSISILEALRAALPVIITDKCNFDDVESFQAGKVVSSKKLTEQLLIAIQECIDNPAQLKSMKKNASRLITSRYSIAHMAQQLQKTYASFI